MRKILLGLSGSIACYKTCELIRLFKKNNDQVRTMVTQNALEFIGASTLSALTGEPVFQNYDSSAHTHIELAKWADQLIIAPATARTIAALAHGFANDLLTTECLAFTGPKAIAPAMNTHMYTNSIVQQNLNALKTHGFQILEPESGELSCGIFQESWPLSLTFN